MGVGVGVGEGKGLGLVAALARRDRNGLKPFERRIEQTVESMPPSPKTITTSAMT